MCSVNGYRLHEEIGSGGYSKVFRVTSDFNVNSKYVCKMVCKKRKLNIASEVRIHKLLNPTKRVPILYDVYEDETAHYMIQEMCMGGALTEYTDCLRDEQRTATMVKNILQTMQTIHNAGIIHRDIKEQNILLMDPTNKPKSDIRICDFGSAVEHDGDNEINVLDVKGTPGYISPEGLGCRVSVKSDVWGLGVIAYRMITGGAYPFYDKNSPAEPSISRVWHSILFEKPLLEGYYWEGVSADAKDFVGACLIKSVADRPSVEECLAHRFVNGLIKTI